MSGKYYLGFVFSDSVSVGLHCTHCYFGNLTDDKLVRVVEAVDSFFRDFGPVEMPKVAFTVPQIFGDKNEGKRVRVLTTTEREAFKLFQKLRDIFTDLSLLNTKWPFRPHVTTKTLGLVYQPFHSYALVKNDQIVKTWKIGEK